MTEIVATVVLLLVYGEVMYWHGYRQGRRKP